MKKSNLPPVTFEETILLQNRYLQLLFGKNIQTQVISEPKLEVKTF